MLKPFSDPLSMFGAKSPIALLEKSVPLDLVMVPFDDRDRYEPKHPEVLSVNPVEQQVRVLLDRQGDDVVELFDSTQIFEYIEDLKPEPALWSAGVASRARTRLLEHQSDEVFFRRLCAFSASRTKEIAQPRGPRVMHAHVTMQCWLPSWSALSISPGATRLPTSRSTWRRFSPSARARR